MRLSAAADPDLVLAAVPGAAVEPAVERLDLEARVLDAARSTRRARASGAPSSRRGRRSADGEDERPRARVPVGALEDPALALEPEPVRLLDVRRGSARRRRRRGGRRARAAPAAASSARSFSASSRHVEQRPERDRDERHALVDRRLAQVAEAEVEQLRDALALRVRSRATASMPGDSSTPITRMPGLRGRDARSARCRRPARRPGRPTRAPPRRRTRRPR